MDYSSEQVIVSPGSKMLLFDAKGVDFGVQQHDLCIRVAIVDYDGESALKRYGTDPKRAWTNPDKFTEVVASRLIIACNQLGSFTDSVR